MLDGKNLFIVLPDAFFAVIHSEDALFSKLSYLLDLSELLIFDYGLSVMRGSGDSIEKLFVRLWRIF